MKRATDVVVWWPLRVWGHKSSKSAGADRCQ